MYSFKSRVRYSECDKNSTLKLENIVNYFQDCSAFHSESLGVGIDFLSKNQKAWVILTWDILIDSYPAFGSEIEITTYAYKFDDIFGYRNFFIKDSNGKCLVKADSKWALIDTNSGRILKIQAEDTAPYKLHTKAPMRELPRKIPRPKDSKNYGKILIDESYIDTNNHVNNQKYIGIALRYLPKNTTFSTVRVEYRRAAKLGDTIFVNFAQTSKGYIFLLNNDNSKTYSVIEFINDCEEKKFIDGK